MKGRLFRNLPQKTQRVPNYAKTFFPDGKQDHILIFGENQIIDEDAGGFFVRMEIGVFYVPTSMKFIVLSPEFFEHLLQNQGGSL